MSIHDENGQTKTAGAVHLDFFKYGARHNAPSTGTTKQNNKQRQKGSRVSPIGGRREISKETFEQKEEQQRSGAYIFLPDSRYGESLISGELVKAAA